MADATRQEATTPGATPQGDTDRRQQPRRGGRERLGSGYYVPATAAKPRFEGSCEYLKGYIFDCSGYKQTDMFIKTQEQLAN